MTGGAAGALPRTKRGWTVFARSTTVMARLDKIDAGIAHVRDEVMTALPELPGWVGLSLMVDRESGRCIVTTAWESEDAMRSSFEETAQMRNQAANEFGGTAWTENWEIAVLHRTHSSDSRRAWVRATWVSVPLDLIDAGIDYFRGAVLPQVEHLPGFCSASLMIDRATGRGVSSVSFSSHDAMVDNRDQATALKMASMRAAGASEVDEAEFELAVAHLRVPELV
ncbi:hypothetical protein SAMN02799620_06103 [Mycolicibacterium fluoranthenivorans]|uniref:Antibiotic biosynthesis monooxygenase n=1 Tax=Mycolicibacterium fluoranthenivorans TaxID=258505 RepID=A0A1G4X1K8_9MYCO|nr:hypothetical protein SAMN02799620_06103 [Mycolicibacterium fluoranthenivorans]